MPLRVLLCSSTNQGVMNASKDRSRWRVCYRAEMHVKVKRCASVLKANGSHTVEFLEYLHSTPLIPNIGSILL